MCNSHTWIQTFNSSPLLSDQHFDTHTRHKEDDQNAANRRQARSAITVNFKRKVNTVFPSTNNGNSTKKSSQVNPSGVGDTWVAELQSFDEFELEKHSA